MSSSSSSSNSSIVTMFKRIKPSADMIGRLTLLVDPTIAEWVSSDIKSQAE